MKHTTAEVVSAMGSAAKMPVTPKPIRGIIRISGNQQKHLPQQSEEGGLFCLSPAPTKVVWLAVWRANRKVSRKKIRSMGTAVSAAGDRC